MVTEGSLLDTNILQQTLSWSRHLAQRMEELCRSQDYPVLTDIELFIEVNGNDCNYYLVNHTERTLFWLDNVDTEELGLPPTTSIAHLSEVCYVSFGNEVNRNHHSQEMLYNKYTGCTLNASLCMGPGFLVRSLKI